MSEGIWKGGGIWAVCEYINGNQDMYRVVHIMTRSIWIKTETYWHMTCRMQYRWNFYYVCTAGFLYRERHRSWTEVRNMTLWYMSIKASQLGTVEFTSAMNGAKFPIILTTFSYFLFRDSVLVLGWVGASVLSLSLISFPTELTFSSLFSRTWFFVIEPVLMDKSFSGIKFVVHICICCA